MLYAFDQPKAESTHKTQYFEIFGNRAIYHEGWFATSSPRAVEKTPRQKLQEDPWELYDTRRLQSGERTAAANPKKP